MYFFHIPGRGAGSPDCYARPLYAIVTGIHRGFYVPRLK